MQATPELFARQNLLGLSLDDLGEYCERQGEKKFRARQLMRWIYQRGCDDIEQMTDLSLAFRAKLQTTASIEAPAMLREAQSRDGTIKWLMQTGNSAIETVYIPEASRGTLCISSQVGCPLACRFCATGQQGFNRNLTAAEIIGQVWRAAQRLTEGTESDRFRGPLTNIVFMGMGEPLLNFRHVVSALKLLVDDQGFGFSKRRITVSTSGVVPGLRALRDEADVALALSLHAANDVLRSELMPINRQYDLATVLSAVKAYASGSKANAGGVTIEYVMLSHINDEPHHALELIQCLRNLPCKVNLIPWNTIPNTDYQPSGPERIEGFAELLRKAGLLVLVRKNRGDDISAACGQLAGSFVDRLRRSGS